MTSVGFVIWLVLTILGLLGLVSLAIALDQIKGSEAYLRKRYDAVVSELEQLRYLINTQQEALQKANSDLKEANCLLETVLKAKGSTEQELVEAGKRIREIEGALADSLNVDVEQMQLEANVALAYTEVERLNKTVAEMAKALDDCRADNHRHRNDTQAAILKAYNAEADKKDLLSKLEQAQNDINHIRQLIKDEVGMMHRALGNIERSLEEQQFKEE